MTIAKPPIVDRETWNEALEKVQKQDDAMMQQVKAAAAARRRLPMTPVNSDYKFVGEDGEQSLADVFQGARQLVVYHFMYAPDWSKGCPHCTLYATIHGHAINNVLDQRDTRYVLMSRAPYEKLKAWKEKKDIPTPWYSAPEEFSWDMGVINNSFGDFPGISVFFRDDDDVVYRSYFTNSAAVQMTMPTHGMLGMTSYGMQERGEDSPEGWPQRFDAM